jgi:predicted NodU family carbamoyl transferase
MSADRTLASTENPPFSQRSMAGKVVAAAQEERFTRIKHDYAFPRSAIDYCLAEAKVSPDQIDYVGF